jgi:type II secretory pathway component PulC
MVMGAAIFDVVLCADVIKYDSGERRDPLIPLIGPNAVIEKTKHKMDIDLQGIIIDREQGSMVLIDGEFYREGDRVGNMNVISIFADRVIFSQDDEQKIIWLREEILDAAAQSTTGREHETNSA